jgi:endonuclease/exonuclease/phosphatase family metal-dependent hydrolase
MPPFPAPHFPYTYDLATEIAALNAHRDAPDRQLPAKSADHLLLATWNIANLGVQKRDPGDYALIAELMSWFDLIAVQEVNDDLSGIDAIHAALPDNYRLLFSGMGGNRERQAFLYDERRVTLLEEVGQIAIPSNQLAHVKLPGSDVAFDGFNRLPYFASFQSGAFRFLLVNVHLLFGDEQTGPARRALETYALAWWADQRHKDHNTYAPNMIPLGDFNLPKMEPGDPIFDALIAKGLKVPPHSSQIGSAIASDNHYDQIAFFPGDTEQQFTGKMNVFDWDNALFQSLLATPGRDVADFHAYCRFHISDHRPLWAQFTTG